MNEIIPFNGYSNDGKPIYYQGKIVGTISHSAYVLTFNAGGSENASSLSYLVSKANNILIMPTSKFDVNNTSFITEESAMIIFGSKTATHSIIKNALGEFGAISDIDVMKRNYYNEIISFLIANGTIFLVFALLSIAGIGGINGIQNIENEKKFAIYYILGLTNKKCAIIEAIRSFLVIGFSFVTAIIVYQIPAVANYIGSANIQVNILTFVFVFIYLLFIYLITSSWFIIKLTKSNALEVYRKKD
jgi:hypothetical protein